MTTGVTDKLSVEQAVSSVAERLSLLPGYAKGSANAALFAQKIRYEIKYCIDLASADTMRENERLRGALVEGLRHVENSVKAQDEYTRRQEAETGVTLDIYIMPEERNFIVKANTLLRSYKELDNATEK